MEKSSRQRATILISWLAIIISVCAFIISLSSNFSSKKESLTVINRAAESKAPQAAPSNEVTIFDTIRRTLYKQQCVGLDNEATNADYCLIRDPGGSITNNEYPCREGFKKAGTDYTSYIQPSLKAFYETLYKSPFSRGLVILASCGPRLRDPRLTTSMPFGTCCRWQGDPEKLDGDQQCEISGNAKDFCKVMPDVEINFIEQLRLPVCGYSENYKIDKNFQCGKAPFKGRCCRYVELP